MSYHDVQQIVKGGNRLYVRASNDLFSYNLNDQRIQTYDKVSQLSDNNITHTAWNSTTGKLIIVYGNQNIDLLSQNDEVQNINSLNTKAMTQDKTVNNIYVYQQFAYLCTGFGLVKLNTERGEITESYILNRSILHATVSDGTIYAYDSNGTVVKALLNTNLINPRSWQETTDYPASLTVTDTTDWDQYHELVSTLQPGGPAYNYFYYMTCNNGQLMTSGGGWKDGGEYSRPGCVQLLGADGEWTVIENATPRTGHSFRDATSIAFDPNDRSHFFLGTAGTGLYEFRNNEMVTNYTTDNSPLLSALSPDKYPNAYMDYVRIDGLCFDATGHRLWMSCSNKTYPILRLDISDGTWKTYDNAQLFYNNSNLPILRNTFIDKQGCLWLSNDHNVHPCLLRIDPETEQMTRYDNFTNQDGTDYTIYYIRSIAQDLDGNIWIGTDQGLFFYDEAQQADPSQGFTQWKVARNDGSDYADYLMTGINITAVAIDGANRKWIGTIGSGVYLISADNNTQIHHFTSEDSPLISDNIESIAINGETGEVYFGTDQGLCSFMADATTAVNDMTKDDVYAFPNPVPSGYNGVITVRGLSRDADVKILTIFGRLVAEGRSNGGTFTWDGRDLSGRRVATGVYMIATAKSDGSKGVVAKIAVVR